MKQIIPQSLRGRLLLLLLSSTLLTLILFGVLMFWVVSSGVQKQFDELLLEEAYEAAVQFVLQDGKLFHNNEDGQLEEPDWLLLQDAEGQILFSKGELQIPPIERLPQTEGAHYLADVDLPGGTDGRLLSFRFRPRMKNTAGVATESAAAHPLPADSLAYGEPVWITIAASLAPVQETLSAALFTIFSGGIGLLVVIGFVTWMGVRVGLLPLQQYSQQLRCLHAGNLEWEDVGSAGVIEELRPFLKEIEGLLERLGQSFVRERQFIDSAAHELRTPLTELRTVSEVALFQFNPEQSRMPLEQCREIALEMEEMVDLLLQLSRCQEDLQGEKQECLFEAIKAGLEQVQGAGQLSVEIQIEPNCGDSFFIEQKVARLVSRNLIHNALEYSAEGGKITLSQKRLEGLDSVVLANGPVTLSAEDLSRLPEPFWRSDLARTSRQHHGLGLTLVEQALANSGFELEFCLEGTSFEVRIRRRPVMLR
jgi:two-component system sensor histidine kinase QseC